MSRIYRFLDRLCAKGTDGADGIKRQVEDISFRHTREVVGGSIKVAFYDMTTLYFEAAEEDSLRIPGFNKDGMLSCPQIFLGLLVAAQGNPIGYEIYEGNIFEGHTLGRSQQETRTGATLQKDGGGTSDESQHQQQGVQQILEDGGGRDNIDRHGKI